MCSPVKQSDNAKADQILDRLLAVEDALTDPEVAYAVTKYETCSRAAVLIKALVKRGMFTNKKDPTNAI